jgi:N6-adenosine-specific RNA methylase IME4
MAINDNETPNTVHGRLLEAVNIAGYTFDRACAELEYLLDADRWKAVGAGYDDINAFLATINFAELRVAAEKRKKLAKRLQEIEASQSATARLLGVNEVTVARDLGKARGATNVDTEISIASLSEENTESQSPASTNVAREWFQQADADPAAEAKRITANQRREDARERLRDERPAQPMPSGLYELLYADPPWRYEHIETQSRAIENQYPTMALDEICALAIPAAADAVLYLWATSPKLAEAFEVLEAWNFSYRTCAVWDKERLGMGYYFRQQHELLLVAARGDYPVPPPPTRPPSVIRERRAARHSQKPSRVYELLEAMYPTLNEHSRVELFQRTPRDGWAAWTNEPALRLA